MSRAGDRFEGTANYVATDDRKVAVKASVARERPLLIKGEPGWKVESVKWMRTIAAPEHLEGRL